MSTQDITAIVIAISAIINAIVTITLAYATYQMADAAKAAAHSADMQMKVTATSTFLSLDEMFIQYKDVRAKLRDGGDWHRGAKGPKFPEDLPAVESYMGLFERIWLLVEEGIIDIDAVDRVYGDRLFNIVINPSIYQEKLVKHSLGWSDFIKLWIALEQSRQTSKRWLPKNRPSPDKLLSQS